MLAAGAKLSGNSSLPAAGHLQTGKPTSVRSVTTDDDMPVLNNALADPVYDDDIPKPILLLQEVYSLRESEPTNEYDSDETGEVENVMYICQEVPDAINATQDRPEATSNSSRKPPSANVCRSRKCATRRRNAARPLCVRSQRKSKQSDRSCREPEARSRSRSPTLQAARPRHSRAGRLLKQPERYC